MKHTLAALFILTRLVSASELPNAPHMAMHQPLETYEPDQRMIVHNMPNHFEAQHVRILDKSFILVHGFYAWSLATDLYLTSRGVSHGCEEASSNLGPYPSTGRIVGVGIAEFGGVIALDAGMKALARNKRLPRWAGMLGGSLGAGVGTYKHIDGASQWLRTNCL